MERIVNKRVIEEFEKHYKNSNTPLIVLYEAPTGYGKTSISPYIAYNIRNYGLFYGYIHVLPMRSIVRSLYLDMIKGGKPPFNKISDLKNNVGYQAGGLFLMGKNPFYSRLYNVTTIDSFILNLLKFSIGEPNTYYKHYEASRSMIFTSMITFDEAHLYGGDPGAPEEALYNSFISLITSLLYLNTPLLILSATQPQSVGKKIYEKALNYVKRRGGRALWIRYGNEIRINEKRIGKITDPDFDECVKTLNWQTKIISENDLKIIAKNIKEKSSTGRVLVIMNKPSRAVKIYDLLTSVYGLDAVLVHGRMKHGEREILEDKINQAEILVATQVVEAGVDVSFDILFTDVAPPTSLVQRVGRINRKLNQDIIGEVYIINDGYQGIYNDIVINETINLIKKYEINRINWRLPRGGSENILGYVDLIDQIYAKISSDISLDSYTISRLIDAILSPQITPRHVENFFYRNCIENRGLIRTSILVSLYPIEKEILKKRSLDELMKESIPVSLHWLVNRSNIIFKKKAWEIYLVISNKKEEQQLKIKEINKNIVMNRTSLRRYICRKIFGYEGEGFFIGLAIDESLYTPGRGLLVEAHE